MPPKVTITKAALYAVIAYIFECDLAGPGPGIQEYLFSFLISCFEREREGGGQMKGGREGVKWEREGV